MHEHHNHFADDKEELMALIKYMAHHNASHTQELGDLVDRMDFVSDDAKALIADAVEMYASANDKLNTAIEMIEGE